MIDYNIKVSKSKVCGRCKIEKPLNKDHFHVVKGNKDGFHGTCKSCRYKQNREAAKKRQRSNRHLIHELTCQNCQKTFMADTKVRKFCGRDCQYESYANEDRWVRQGRKYGSEQAENSLDDRERNFEKRFNEYMDGEFKYHSGYTQSDKPFKCECLRCGHVQERNARVLRAKYGIKCDVCEIELSRHRKKYRDALNEVIRMTREKQRAIDRFVLDINESVNEEYRRHIKICEKCDEVYKAKTSRSKYCSDRCRNRSREQRRELRRRNFKLNNGEYDTISLVRLIERDKNTCHICGGKCDKSDHVITDDGHFIAGRNYPSIDHVRPVSKGGTHTWDNVKLAHFHCNALKGDSTEE